MPSILYQPAKTCAMHTSASRRRRCGMRNMEAAGNATMIIILAIIILARWPNVTAASTAAGRSIYISENRKRRKKGE